MALMEAMCCGLPCVVSKIRGNVDLIDEKGGALFDPHSVKECVSSLQSILKEDITILGKNNSKKIEKFSLPLTNLAMKKLYEEGING